MSMASIRARLHWRLLTADEARAALDEAGFPAPVDTPDELVVERLRAYFDDQDSMRRKAARRR